MKLVKQGLSITDLKIETGPLFICRESNLLSAIESSGRIMIPIPGGYQCCKPEEIIYLKAESNYTEIHYLDGSKKLLSKTLKIMEDILKARGFYRLHKTYVVNVSHITEILYSSGKCAVKVMGGIIIPVSRNRNGLSQKKYNTINNDDFFYHNVHL